MRFAVTVQHPAHVHFFRNAVEELREAGHDVRVYARDKDVTVDLLEAFDLPYEVLAGNPDSLLGLAATQVRYEYALLRAVRRVRPDVITSIGGLAAAHVARLTSARSVVFTDTEVAANRLAVPFADVVCTPRHFGEEFGDKQVRYDGFQELAYLHPDRFEPDRAALRAHGIDPAGWYAVLRFSDMAAHHDVGEAGFSARARRELVARLRDQGPVYVSVEGGDADLAVPPHLAHDLLAAADLFVTDSSTMATEAAVLGTPTVRSNTIAESGALRNFVVLADQYDLVYSTPDETEAVERAASLATDPAAAAEWDERRQRLLADTIDVTAFVTGVLTAVTEAAHA